MNKNTFLNELAKKLHRLPKQDFDDAMSYYNEYFMDAGVDEYTDVTQLVGSVDEVASRIIDESTDKQIEIANTEGGVKNKSRAIWYVLLGIFAAPIAFPIAIVIFAIIFAIIVTVVAVVFSLIVASVCVVIVGFAAIPALFWAESGSQVLVLLGMICMCIAIGVLFCIAFYKIGELVIKGIIKFARYIGRKRKNKNSAAVQTNQSVQPSHMQTGQPGHMQSGQSDQPSETIATAIQENATGGSI